MTQKKAHGMGKAIGIATIAFLCLARPCACLESDDYPAEYRVSVETEDNGTTVESFYWGALKVAFETFVDGRYASTARVLDPSGATLLELRGARFITPSLTEGKDDFAREFFLDLFGDGKRELKLTSWSGGAYGCYADMVYSYDEKRGIKNVLAYEGGEGRIGKGSDDLADDDELNMAARSVVLRSKGEGVPRIVLADYSLHALGGQTHGSVAFAVLRWERDHYALANEDCPEISGLAIERYRRRVEGALGAGGADGTDGIGGEGPSSALVSDIVGYLSNAAMIGQYDQALAWVKERLFAAAESATAAEKEKSFRRLDAEYFEKAKSAPRLIGDSIAVDRRSFLYIK